jgi:hypothetical protein
VPPSSAAGATVDAPLAQAEALITALIIRLIDSSGGGLPHPMAVAPGRSRTVACRRPAPSPDGTA